MLKHYNILTILDLEVMVWPINSVNLIALDVTRLHSSKLMSARVYLVIILI
jgi:hypothetical protein